MSVGQQDWTLHRKGTIDQGRHLEKIKEALKENLADIVSQENIIGNTGEKTVKIPVKVMDDYHFRHLQGDPDDREHVSQGDGSGQIKPGDHLGRRPKKGKQGAGGGAAGGTPGEDYYEAEIDIDTLAAIIFEDLGLPRLKPVANKLIVSSDAQFTDVTTKGNISNIDKRRSLKENIKRNVIVGREPGSNWHDSDLRYRTWEPVTKEESNAVVFALIDSSGSMGPYEKYIARSFYFWMVNFLRTKYNRVQIRFISHHTEAKEVTEDEFFHRGESGGTMASSAYKLAHEMLLADYPPSSWNAYVFHFSDGDNFTSDNDACLHWARLLKARCNQVGYGQIGREQNYGFGAGIASLAQVFRPLEGENFLSVMINGKGDIWPALKRFFAKEIAQ